MLILLQASDAFASDNVDAYISKRKIERNVRPTLSLIDLMDVGGLTRSNLTLSKSEKNGEGRGGDAGEWTEK
ncbi:hypothetical protein E2C01_049755 [Portunus trituberculatus]|uniref:Uncharacterized protein n=1 Tax=Portunus trituberculatus TaxID=210409 RepID=A0A5B7G6F6_PORTR|nr:hypothetical protein [Portunus trituberculatus]